MAYLVLVDCIRLKCFVSIHGGEILADQRGAAAAEALAGMFQPAVHLIVKNPPIGLQRGRPGEQEGGLQAAWRVSLKVQQWRRLSRRGSFGRENGGPVAGGAAQRRAGFQPHFVPAHKEALTLL